MQSILEKNGNDVLQAVSGFLGAAAGKTRNTENKKDNTYLGGSISKYVKDLVMTFPTMFDTSLTPSTAAMISKANERNIVTMLQLLFGSMQISAQGGKEALEKVHNNIATSGDALLDIRDEIEGMKEQATGVNINGVRTIDAVREMENYLRQYHKSYPACSLKETPVARYYTCRDRYGKLVIREAAPSKYEDKREEREVKKAGREERKERREEQLQSLPRVMTDQDYRKANELAPTLMIITFNEVDANNNLVGKSSFAAGVKSRLIPVESSDIIERLAAKKNTALNFLNLVRATTGEISFVKDFLFAVQQSKILAKNSAKKGPVAKMWNVLDSRHTKNNKNAYNKQGNDASAITTLVVNQETANMLKKEYNFDIENPKTAKYIMNEYNLLALMICDESIEVAKILYHGNDEFEANSYTMLNRENDNAKAYKDVINLVNKAGR